MPISEGHSKNPAVSQRPRTTNIRKNTLVNSRFQDRKTTSWTLSQETDLFAARQLYARYDDAFSSTDCLQDNHYCGLPWHCSTETVGDSGAFNDRTRYRSHTTLYFQTDFGCSCSIMMDVSVSRGIEKNAHLI